MKKRLFYILMMLAIVFVISGKQTQAETYGNYEYEILEDGTVEITGYYGNDSDLSIPQTINNRSVTQIGDHAFDHADSDDELINLLSVTIPNGVTSVGEDAFWGCRNLVSVNLPDSVSEIGSAAFQCCFNLKNINIPSSLTVLNNSVFAQCTSLDNIVIPEGVTCLIKSPFYGCTNLTSVYIPKSVTKFGASYSYIDGSINDESAAIFTGCKSLREINVAVDNPNFCSEDGILFDKQKTLLIEYPEGKTSTSYTVPKDIRDTISGFNNCEYLSELNVEDGSVYFSSVDGILYNYDKTFMICCPRAKSGVINSIPDSVTMLDISNCEKITGISVSQNITYITNSFDAGMFPGCSSLREINVDENNTVYSSIDGLIYNKNKSILYCCPEGRSGVIDSIPETTTTIDGNAFAKCKRLTEINIPQNIERINQSEGYYFDGCDNLEIINVDEDNLNYSSHDGILYNKEQTSIIFCPYGKTGDVNSLPTTVTKINENAFNKCVKITSITIPDGITEIGRYAFANCKKLASVNLPETIQTIAYYAFGGCVNLKSVTLPKSIVTIENNALGINLYQLIDAFTIYGYEGTVAESYANKIGCTFISLGPVNNEPPQVPSTDDPSSNENPPSTNNSSSNGNAISTNNPPASPGQSIQTGNMSNVAIVGTVLTDRSSKASYTVTSTNGTVAYKGTTDKKTKSISIPATVTSSGVTYKVTSIAPGALKNNKTITKATIGSNITSIGKQAFSGCKKLKTITIKTKNLTAKSIGSKAFTKAGSSNYKKMMVKVPKSKKTLYKKILKKKGLSGEAKVK